MRSFTLDRYQSEYFVSAIRCRFDVLSVLMQAVKIIINYYPPAAESVAGKIDIVNSRMSRLFYSSDDKFYSLAFPFRVLEEEGVLLVKTFTGIDIDSRLSSDILLTLKVLKEKRFKSEWDLIAHFEGESAAENFWPVLSELLDAEDGYLRFDHDPVRQDGHIHPLDHTDLFYTNGASFKLGLHKRLSFPEILDILDRSTDCHYLGVARNLR